LIEEGDMDALDAFMMSIKAGGLDSASRRAMKCHTVELRQQKSQLERHVALAKPCSLPPLASRSSFARFFQFILHTE